MAEAYSYTFEGCYNDVELSWHDDFIDDVLSLLLCSYQLDDSAAGQPFLELFLPISQGNFRRYDNMRTFYFLELLNKRDNRDSLNGLTQTHIISKYSIDSTLIK